MNKELIVAGYIFPSLEEANVARLELNKIEKLNEKTENADISLLYKIYVKSIEKNTFRTPVGYEYLSKLKDILEEDGSFDLVPIPVNASAAVASRGENSKDQISTLKNENSRKSKMFAWSLFINVILFLMVLLMFYITTTSKSPNIINYENALVDKYSVWEQELEEREAAVSQKEKLFD